MLNESVVNLDRAAGMTEKAPFPKLLQNKPSGMN